MSTRRPRLRRHTPSWNTTGEEPDYRFTLANERTLLAWIRTALSLLAGSVALAQLVPPFAIPGSRTAIAVALAVGGATLPILAYRRWAHAQRAMRHSQPLKVDQTLAAMTYLLGLLGVVIAIAVVVSLRG